MFLLILFSHLFLYKILIDFFLFIIGPVASFNNCILVDKLPKTRSGKILRGTIKKIVDGKVLDKIPPTIDDASVIPKIQADIENYGLLKPQTPKPKL